MSGLKHFECCTNKHITSWQWSSRQEKNDFSTFVMSFFKRNKMFSERKKGYLSKSEKALEITIKPLLSVFKIVRQSRSSSLFDDNNIFKFVSCWNSDFLLNLNCFVYCESNFFVVVLTCTNTVLILFSFSNSTPNIEAHTCQ
jgi:hypothetical protein